mgnify:CR=1 FL=1
MMKLLHLPPMFQESFWVNLNINKVGDVEDVYLEDIIWA